MFSIFSLVIELSASKFSLSSSTVSPQSVYCLWCWHMSVHFQLPCQLLMVKVHRTSVVKHIPFSLAVFSFSALFDIMQERKRMLLELNCHTICTQLPGLVTKQDSSKWSLQIKLYLFGTQFVFFSQVRL